MAKVNPFRPNSPVHPGTFVGRIDEVLRLDSHLIQTKAGNPTNFILTGERGIGKSSLMFYLKFVAEGEMPIENDQVKFLVIYTDVDRTTSQLGLVKKIELGIRRELEKTEPARQFMTKAWEFIQRVEAAGVKINPADLPKSEELLLEEFSYTLSDIVNRICSPKENDEIFNANYDGVLLLIDETDNAQPFLDLGSFLKLLSERLQRHGCNHLMIGLAGLPVIRDILVSSHPSSLRIFDEMTLDRLTLDEIHRVIERCLEASQEQNKEQIQITDDAKSSLSALSEGYPHFVQQFGYSAFAVDTDNIIDRDDVIKGAFGRGGALELIGDRYYRDDFYRKLQTDSYRQVLRIMADNFDEWITKEEIRKKFKGTDATLRNAIKALRDRHIILSKEGQAGIYRLQHKAFAWWIKLYTTDPRAISEELESE